MSFVNYFFYLLIIIVATVNILHSQEIEEKENIFNNSSSLTLTLGSEKKDVSFGYMIRYKHIGFSMFYLDNTLKNDELKRNGTNSIFLAYYIAVDDFISVYPTFGIRSQNTRYTDSYNITETMFTYGLGLNVVFSKHIGIDVSLREYFGMSVGISFVQRF